MPVHQAHQFLPVSLMSYDCHIQLTAYSHTSLWRPVKQLFSGGHIAK